MLETLIRSMFGYYRDTAHTLCTNQNLAGLRQCVGRYPIVFDLPVDILKFSSEILVELFREAITGELPHWCRVLSIDRDYRARSYDTAYADLKELYYQPARWQVRRDTVVLRLGENHHENNRFKKNMPQWLIREGSKFRQIVFDRPELEKFLKVEFDPLKWAFRRMTRR